MALALHELLARQKIRSVYIIFQPGDLVFQKYPLLNYLNPRNRFVLDRSLPNEILPGKLYLGAYEHAKDVETLEELLHITHVLNCTKEIPNFSAQISYLNIRILDEPQVRIVDHFEEAFNFIDQALE